MSARVPPHDLSAEEALLGSMMLSRDAIRGAIRAVRWQDFYRPAHSTLWTVMVRMYGDGHAIDTVTLAAALAEAGELDAVGGRKRLDELQAHTPASANAGHYARVIAGHAAKRQIIATGGRLEAIGYDPTLDPVHAVESAKVAAEEIVAPGIGGAESPTLDALLGQLPPTPDWLIPGVLARYERIAIIAMEGGGKSMMIRQWAALVAQGLHPMLHPSALRTTGRLPRRLRVLLVDLENPPDLLLRKFQKIRDSVARIVGDDYREEYLRLELRPEGIDITSRADALWLEERVAVNAPDLVCIGPLYKLHNSDESDFRAVRQVQDVLDSIRKRYAVSFIMETHAPHEAFKGGILRISGSRAWMRWPEFVLSLQPQSEAKLTGAWILEHARRPRDERSFPRLWRPYGIRLPWEVIEEIDPQEGFDL